jgi:hypothetical protein
MLRWIVANVTPAEQGALLRGLQSDMPSSVFAETLAALKPHIDERDWQCVARGLGM